MALKKLIEPDNEVEVFFMGRAPASPFDWKDLDHDEKEEGILKPKLLDKSKLEFLNPEEHSKQRLVFT